MCVGKSTLVLFDTQTNLDVLQEHQIDEYWHADGERPLSGSWVGFARFTILKKPPPDGHMWAGERLTKIQSTSRPDDIWPEVWSKIFNEKQDSNGIQANPCQTLHAD